MNKHIFEGTFNHILKELEITNIFNSIKNSNFEELRKAHDSIHEFLLLAPLCLAKNRHWHEKSAFLCYSWDIFYSTHRSLLEALAGYYNVAFSLLRNTVELVIKAALWECLAHKKFREEATILKKYNVKIGNLNKSLIDWFDDVIKLKPQIEEELEKISGGIFDKLAPIFEDQILRKLVPSNDKIIDQLIKWKIFESIPNPKYLIYDQIYKELCKDVHIIPDKTDIGRKLLSQKDIFKVEVIYNEFKKYMNLLHKIMDICIVIELNILKEWIVQNETVKIRLKKRLTVIENLGLIHSVKKLRQLIGKIEDN